MKNLGHIKLSGELANSIGSISGQIGRYKNMLKSNLWKGRTDSQRLRVCAYK